MWGSPGLAFWQQLAQVAQQDVPGGRWHQHPHAGRRGALKMTPARGRDASGIQHAQTLLRQLVLHEHGP